MTYLSPDGGAMSQQPSTLTRQVLDLKIALRRARLAALETEMIAACKAAVLGARSQASATYPLSIVVNLNGERIIDEGADYRNYTYATYGREVTKQPQ
jgi:hypothetical protein